MQSTIYDETWNEASFMFRNTMNLKTLPKNHLMKLGSLKFDFVEYKSNQQLGCQIYQRMVMHCLNQYGLFHDSIRTECLDARRYLGQCKRLNESYSFFKKYFPEDFVENPYSRDVPHFLELDPMNFQLQ